MDELAAQVLRTLLVKQHDRGSVVDRQPVALERGQLVGVGRPGPDLDRLMSASGRLGQLDGGQAAWPRGAQVREEAELDAEVHQPGVVEPGQARDEIVEAFIELHRWNDCRTHVTRRDTVRTVSDGVSIGHEPD